MLRIYHEDGLELSGISSASSFLWFVPSDLSQTLYRTYFTRFSISSSPEQVQCKISYSHTPRPPLIVVIPSRKTLSLPYLPYLFVSLRVRARSRTIHRFRYVPPARHPRPFNMSRSLRAFLFANFSGWTIRRKIICIVLLHPSHPPPRLACFPNSNHSRDTVLRALLLLVYHDLPGSRTA